MVGRHKSALDHLSPAEIRVVCEQLLYTMGPEQRAKLMSTYPGIYCHLYPDVTIYFRTPGGEEKQVQHL